MANVKKNSDTPTDAALARKYEAQDPQLAAALRVPQGKRTWQEIHRIAARLTFWAAREGRFIGTV